MTTPNLEPASKLGEAPFRAFLAVVIIRVAETRTDQAWRTIRAELGTIGQGHFRSRDGEFA